MKIFYGFNEKKRFFFRQNNIFFIFIIIIIFCVDRYSKFLAINKLKNNNYFLNDHINFDLIWNTGIGFGLLGTVSSIFYNLITIIIGVVISILIYIAAISQKIDQFVYSLIIGGALGNFYDRLIFKAVPDFIDIHFNNFHWFTFNVADIFISLGIIIYMCKSFFINNNN